MSETTKRLTLRVARLQLSAADDLAARFPLAFGCIELWVDTLVVKGWVRLPGRDLRIQARHLEARPFDGRPAVIDVSGAPAEPAFDPEAASPDLNGSTARPDGRAGRDGGAGQPGGRVELVVDVIDGEFGLAANGSAGADGQRGGDGAKPATPHGADAVFVKAKWPSRSRWGGRTLQGPGLKIYQAWAAGQPGGDAKRGGAAGASGRPGDGGAGGLVRLGWTGPTPPVVATIADGGAPGRAAVAARPGPEGQRGSGGRHRVYVYGVFIGTHEGFVGDKNKYLKACVSEHRLAARAASGRTGAGLGPVPPAPTATAGPPGEVVRAAATAQSVAASLDLDGLRWWLALAASDAAGGSQALAAARFDWVLRVAIAHADPGAAAVAEAAQSGLQALKEATAETTPPAPSRGRAATRKRSAVRR